MNKIIIAFCEGQDDIAFLSEILSVHEFKPYKKIIKDFIEPLNKQYMIKLQNKEIADRKLGFQSEYMIPSVALQNESANTLVLLHNLGGDQKIEERNDILSMYQNIQSGEDDFTNYNLNFRFLYFFDADDKGISTRMDEINEELELNDKLSHSEIKEIDSYEWGCYIFHKDKDSGDLEDIILDLMKPNNETIFNNSSSFLTDNALDETRCRRFKEKKSIISIAGQLQFSGVNNSVIISKSDYITCTDISDNEQCQEIIKLFQSKNE